MSRIDELKQEIAKLSIGEQAILMADMQQHIADELGYDDPNLQIAEKNLAEYRAGNMTASPWEEVRRRIFDDQLLP